MRLPAKKYFFERDLVVYARLSREADRGGDRAGAVSVDRRNILPLRKGTKSQDGTARASFGWSKAIFSLEGAEEEKSLRKNCGQRILGGEDRKPRCFIGPNINRIYIGRDEGRKGNFFKLKKLSWREKPTEKEKQGPCRVSLLNNMTKPGAPRAKGRAIQKAWRGVH